MLNIIKIYLKKRNKLKLRYSNSNKMQICPKMLIKCCLLEVWMEIKWNPYKKILIP